VKEIIGKRQEARGKRQEAKGKRQEGKNPVYLITIRSAIEIDRVVTSSGCWILKVRGILCLGYIKIDSSAAPLRR
ncbi:MAG: hypothetical protein F6J98_35595, partial [Moorea sp. SIO4G2]|nr:hypothetical protein [Moorena sp. SIO4G2]